MLQTMLIGSSLATSLFVLVRCRQCRPRPWLDSAASALLLAAMCWLIVIGVDAALYNSQSQREGYTDWCCCSFYMTLFSAISAFGLALFSGAGGPAETEGLGLSSAEESV